MTKFRGGAIAEPEYKNWIEFSLDYANQEYYFTKSSDSTPVYFTPTTTYGNYSESAQVFYALQTICTNCTKAGSSVEGYGVLDGEYVFELLGKHDHESTHNLDEFRLSATLSSAVTAEICAYNGVMEPSGKPYDANIYMIGASLARIRVKL